MLSILLLLTAMAAGRAVPLTNSIPTSCADIVDGELLVKYKTEQNKKIAFQYHQLKAKKHLESKLSNFIIKDLNSAVDLEELLKPNPREIVPNAVLKQRRKELLALSLNEGLDDLYVIKVQPKPNVLFDWIDTAQGRIQDAKCKKMLAMLTELKSDPSIDFVEPNYRIALAASTSAGFVGAEAQAEWNFDYEALWGLDEIQAVGAWQQTRGEGVVVAVIDSGVNYNHPDLWNNIWVNPAMVADRNNDKRQDLNDLDTNRNHAIDSNELIPGAIGYDFIDKDAAPMDEAIGHGTHVAGIIAADASNSIGIAGAAPRARIMPLRIFDNQGRTTVTLLIKALLYAAKNGADVCNMSLTSSAYSEALARTVKVVSKEMILVAAAGNSGQDISAINSSTVATPAMLPGVIAVGAMTNSGTKASFSNYGFNVDFAAPGSSRFGSANILSTDLSKSGYRLRAGTSMAAPFVTAAVALLKAKNPKLKVDQAINLLRLNAIEIRSSQSLGAGLIQVSDALRASNRVPRVMLKVAEYQHPTLKTVSGAISIQGSITGTDLMSYKVEIGSGTNPSTWDLIRQQEQRFMKKGVLVHGFETHAYKNGLYVLRLSAVNSLGEMVYDQAVINIKN